MSDVLVRPLAGRRVRLRHDDLLVLAWLLESAAPSGFLPDARALARRLRDSAGGDNEGDLALDEPELRTLLRVLGRDPGIVRSFPASVRDLHHEAWLNLEGS